MACAGLGPAKIFIDGVRKDTVNFRSPTTTYQANMFDMPLTDKLHTLKIVPVGTSSGGSSDVGVDAVLIE